MLNYIDLFAGCGGLTEGFEKKKEYNLLAAVEWEKPAVTNLINNLSENYNIKNADEIVMHFDLQRTKELYNGWDDDPIYGKHKGLDHLVGEKKVDLIVGGPPCQAYSIAGRIRCDNKMVDDYRNYLFESYMNVVRRYKPNVFVFENVVGILSAKPDGETLVTDLIREEIESSGYEIVDDLRTFAQFDFSNYGVPQNRKRVIIIGIKRGYKENIQDVLKSFYIKTLPQYKEETKTVRDALADLPKMYPGDKNFTKNNIKFSHTYEHQVSNHLPRYHNERDIKIFQKLCEDIELEKNEYANIESLKELYYKMTGKKSNVHKYHVLRWDKPSNTIPAHLYKDGLRHIHPDSTQSRTISVREAARLQTFADNYEFVSAAGHNYKMIGNAVPPKFSEKLAEALLTIL